MDEPAARNVPRQPRKWCGHAGWTPGWDQPVAERVAAVITTSGPRAPSPGRSRRRGTPHPATAMGGARSSRPHTPVRTPRSMGRPAPGLISRTVGGADRGAPSPPQMHKRSRRRHTRRGDPRTMGSRARPVSPRSERLTAATASEANSRTPGFRSADAGGPGRPLYRTRFSSRPSWPGRGGPSSTASEGQRGRRPP